jgi:hypothetical protein
MDALYSFLRMKSAYTIFRICAHASGRAVAWSRAVRCIDSCAQRGLMILITLLHFCSQSFLNNQGYLAMFCSSSPGLLLHLKKVLMMVDVCASLCTTKEPQKKAHTEHVPRFSAAFDAPK